MEYTEEQKELFDEREDLAEQLRKLQCEYEERIDEVDENYLPGLNEFRSRLSKISAKLHVSGVPAEDC